MRKFWTFITSKKSYYVAFGVLRGVAICVLAFLLFPEIKSVWTVLGVVAGGIFIDSSAYDIKRKRVNGTKN